MAKRRSTERQLAEQFFKKAMQGARGGRKNGGGKKGLAFIPLILVAIMCAWAQCNPVPIEELEEDPKPVASSSDGYSAERDSVLENYADSEASYGDGSLQERVPDALLPSSVEGERVTIERVVDGDTFIVQSVNGRERVRLIGANTPETVKKNWPVEPFGPEASAYSKKRVAETGYVATLVSDGDKTDRYGRRLAFVYLGNDTISLNEELVRVGLAAANLQYKFSKEMKDRLSAAQELAKSEKRGIHSLPENQ